VGLEVDPASLLLDVGASSEAEAVGDGAAAGDSQPIAGVAVSGTRCLGQQMATPARPRLGRDEPYGASFRARPEQRPLGPAQDLDTFQVEDGRIGTVGR